MHSIEEIESKVVALKVKLRCSPLTATFGDDEIHELWVFIGNCNNYSFAEWETIKSIQNDFAIFCSLPMI